MMKKLLTIVLALTLMLSLVACGAKDETKATITESTTDEASVTAESQLLSEILATDTYLSLADEEYLHVVDYISTEEPAEISGDIWYWYLGEGYTLKLDNSTRTLTLRTGDYWRRVLCENVDYPNSLPAYISMTVVNDYTFYECLDSIEVWKLGKKLFSVDLPSSEIEVVGTIKTDDNSFKTIVRSDSTIGLIISENGEFRYEEIVSDCSRSIQTYQGSVWYVNMNADLIHLNIVNKETELIAEDVTTLVSVHDGIYSVGWREKGSLEWHEPDFYVSQNGEITPWSEHGGM